VTSNEIVLKVMDDEALKKEKEKEAAKARPAGPAKEPERKEAPPLDVAGLKPGEAVNGLKFAVAANKADLKMEPIEYAAASPNAPPFKVERAELTFSVTNVSDKPVKLNTYDLLLSDIMLVVSGPDDKSVRVLIQPIMRNHMALPSERDIVILEPGKTWTCPDASFFPDDLGSYVYQLLKPGEFRVRAVLTCSERKDLPFAAGAWTGRVMSNEATFKAAVK
jgi:hypothetical protein